KATSTRTGRPTPPSTRRGGRRCRMRREDVGALRARVLRDADNASGRGVKLADMTFSVEGDTLDALCRAWLALDRAVAGDVECSDAKGAWLVVANDAPLYKGQRVRIVPEAGQEVGSG